MIGNLSAGTYYLSVFDGNGCSSIDSYTLTEPSALNISSVTTSTYGGYNVSVNGGNDGSIDVEVDGGADCQSYSYQWSGPNGFTSTSEDLSGLIAGTYTLTVRDGNTCSIVSVVTLTQPSQLVPRMMQQASVQSSPNPFTDKTYIRFVLPENDVIQLYIYNSNGKMLKQLANQRVKANEEYTIEFDGSEYADGIYVYKLVTGKDVYMGKMILAK